MSVLALFKFRHRPGWKRSRWVDVGYPAIPLTYVGMSLWVFIYFLQLWQVEALWSLVTIAAGALLYQLNSRKAGLPT